MPTYPVGPKKQSALQSRMKKLGIRETDLDERFVRSSGPGGQNVNKVSTCVVLRHLPTGFEVKCQRERSQALNRYLAKRMLVDKIEEARLGLESSKRQEYEKIRRQKRRRSRRQKEKMLDSKKIQSTKKALRRGFSGRQQGISDF